MTPDNIIITPETRREIEQLENQVVSRLLFILDSLLERHICLNDDYMLMRMYMGVCTSSQVLTGRPSELATLLRDLISGLFRPVMQTGTPEYNAYIQSDEWRIRRQEAILAAGQRCQLCNSPYRLEVHHRTYERLGKEEPGDLTVLCDECHRIFHRHRRLHTGGAE